MEKPNVYGIRIQVIAITSMVVSMKFTTTAIPGHILLTRALATMPTTCPSAPLAVSTRRTTTIEHAAVQCVASKSSTKSLSFSEE